MPKQTLKQNLEKLRSQLNATRELDAETREELAAVADSIERILHEPEGDHHEAFERIEDAALSFEARHPAFARILSEVTDAIAKLGI